MLVPMKSSKALLDQGQFMMEPWRDQATQETQDMILEKCGLGTLNLPLIQWCCNIDESDVLIKYECEATFTHLARKFECTHVYITRPWYKTIQAWNSEIRDSTGVHWEWCKADKQLTVRFATADSQCNITAHVYLAPDFDSILQIMQEDRVDFTVGYDDRVLQVWTWDKSRYLNRFFENYLWEKK
ncbi:hypothetical protein F5B20DRAFT_592511 [Whalleya microplaca]|nr:hypothetical protein F5B20DRAFT_592511 [Whalleya microplaca]